MSKLGHVEIVERRAKTRIGDYEHYEVRVKTPDGREVELLLTALEFFNASARKHVIGHDMIGPALVS